MFNQISYICDDAYIFTNPCMILDILSYDIQDVSYSSYYKCSNLDVGSREQELLNIFDHKYIHFE